MKPELVIGIVLAICVATGIGFLFLNGSSEQETSSSIGKPYVEIADPAGFVNSEEFTIGEYIGKKVVLIDFMTYSCINCQRTFPYVNAWYEKYEDDGLIVIGIHTPEFAFEKDIRNVREAMQRFGIKYPVVLDNNYGTWRAYENQYWPRKYLIDIHGNIVYDHIGEGAYEETEAKIRELLKERAEFLNEEINLGGVTTVNAKKATKVQSPETYFGASRNEYLGNGVRGSVGERAYTLPQDPKGNTLYLGGTWKTAPEYTESVTESSVLYRYSAGAVYLVANAASPIVVEVWQDGKLLTEGAGSDVKNGQVTITESRLYDLVNNVTPGEHVLELRVKDAGVQFFAFTFG
ncbi:redoxin family protein [Patescibacteria group bacterium]|nr:redoxin family protein [Patescibacteria group bacterium]